MYEYLMKFVYVAADIAIVLGLYSAILFLTRDHPITLIVLLTLWLIYVVRILIKDD